MSLLSQGNRAPLRADVEWHIVPCIDPDGAILNEGWSQQPFTFQNFVLNFYLQSRPERERIEAYRFETLFLGNAHTFIRLLEASKQTSAVRQASQRLKRIFDDAIHEMNTRIDFDAFEVIDCDTLAKVQLGSGLIALNSVLEARIA